MMTSRSLSSLPAALSEADRQWAASRLWRLMIPVFMGLGQRVSGQFGTTLALGIMLLAHAIASPEWQQLVQEKWHGLLRAVGLLPTVNLAVREGFDLFTTDGKPGDADRFER